MSEHKCPECGSSNVFVGAFVLSCGACGWDHNNKHPCSVCGAKSVSAYGSDNPTTGRHVGLYGCKAHPVTRQLGIDVEKIAAHVKASKTEPASAGVEITPLVFCDAIVSMPVIYGEPIPFLIQPQPKGYNEPQLGDSQKPAAG